MVCKLVEATEAIEVKRLTLLAYGQPGSRKSSLSQTADKPFTLAFDPGIYRAHGRKSCMLFDGWEDVVAFDGDAELLRRNQQPPQRFTGTEDQDRYLRALRYYTEAHTVVIDTIGMCLDRMSDVIARESPKNTSPFGGLSLPGYGVLKNRFAQWSAPWKARGQDVVLCCHEKEVKRGDEVYYQPDITGGSYNTVMNYADAVGYLHFEGGKRVIGFHPTDRYFAKTPPCGWGVLVLPDFAKEPDYLAKLLAQAKESMGRVSGESAKLAQQVAELRQRIEGTTTAELLSALLPELHGVPEAIRRPVWTLCTQHAERKGWKWEREAKRFSAPAASEPPPPTAEELPPIPAAALEREPGVEPDEAPADTNFKPAKKRGKKAGAA